MSNPGKRATWDRYNSGSDTDTHDAHAYFEHKERHGDPRTPEEVDAAHRLYLEQRAKDNKANAEAIQRRIDARRRSGRR